MLRALRTGVLPPTEIADSYLPSNAGQLEITIKRADSSV
jgi:hypothetical protein